MISLKLIITLMNFMRNNNELILKVKIPFSYYFKILDIYFSKFAKLTQVKNSYEVILSKSFI
jgi:hypothetical protein